MTIWLVRRIAMRLRGWRLYLTLLVAAFAVGWAMMAAFEPPDSTIDQPEHYWWWYIVTAFTVGYGDYFPVSTGGRIAALMVMATAIGVVAALVGDLVERASELKSKRLKGLIQVKAERHFVILGYTPGRTERLMEELCVQPDNQVVLCATLDQVAEDPMPKQERVRLVRGDLMDRDTLDRASIGTARSVIVDSPDGDDDKTAMTALVVDRVNPDVHVVVAARDLDRTARLLRQFGPGFECAEWHDVRMLSEAAQDPGITRFHADLKSGGTGSDTHSLRLPDEVRGRQLSDLHIPLKERLNVTVCALGHGDDFVNNPPLSTTLEPGMRLYYIGSRRLAWSDIQAAIP